MKSNKPQWMNDPLVSDINPNKLDFLQEIVFNTKGKTQKELFQFMMKIIKSGKLNQIQLKDEEVKKITQAIKNNSTPEELIQIHKFINLLEKRK